MKQRAYEAFIAMGYSPDEAREAVESATEEELASIVPQAKPKPKAKASQKPKPVAKASQKPKPVAEEFDPVAAAVGIVQKAEERPTYRYSLTRIYKMKFVDEMDSAVFKAVEEEMKTVGGHWFEPWKCFIFESNPEEKL